MKKTPNAPLRQAQKVVLFSYHPFPLLDFRADQFGALRHPGFTDHRFRMQIPHSLLVILIMALSWLPCPANPLISEFLASNATGLADGDGDRPDWIEIHNPTDAVIDLNGWHLTDDPQLPDQWTFPTTSLAAGEHLIVFASGKDRRLPGSPLHTNFRLAQGGEYLALCTPEGIPVSEWQYPPQATDLSYGLTSVGGSVTLIAGDSPVRVLVPDADDNQLIGDTWRGSGPFDDSSWRSGRGGVGFERFSGFEDEIGLDLESEAWAVNSSVYLRLAFGGIPDRDNLATLTLRMKFDDGFAAFLNGTPVASANAPSPLTWNSDATSGVNDAAAVQYTNFDLTPFLPELRPADNILAIHGLNQFSNSGDFLIRAELVATLNTPPDPVAGYFTFPTPGQPNPLVNSPVPIPPDAGPLTISEPSGVKRSAVTVTLTAENPDATIHYTLDGSDPTVAAPQYLTPLTLSDPARLRARAFLPGKEPGPLALADFSFLHPSLQNYLADVPVIVMDNFGAGSYPNKGRSNDGSNIVQVPRQANVMSFFAPGEAGLPFQNPPLLESRTGCRVRGSSSSTFPRKPLSVEFWNEHDQDLNLSPFGFDAEADWVLNPPNPVYDRALVHNAVSFQVAERLGALAPRHQVVVVFQNTDGGPVTAGDLAGIYLFSEKIERNRMGMNFDRLADDASKGGWLLNIDRMQAIPEGLPVTTTQPNFHAPGPNGILQIPDDQPSSGGTQTVDDISVYYHSYLNFENPGGYEILPDQREAIQTATRAMDAAVWNGGFLDHLDPDSWARAFLVHNFSRNQDAHVLSTFLYRETPHSLIKVGPVWDFDRAYTWQGSPRAQPLWASDRDWYAGLFRDPDFRQTVQDHWQTAREFALSDQTLAQLVDEAADGLRPDQIAASGLAFSTWQNRLGEMKSWMTQRARYLDEQAPVLPVVSPASGRYDSLPEITLTATGPGTIHYTLDGTDPRAPGGAPAANSLVWHTPLLPEARTIVTARLKNGSRWSAPISGFFYRESDIPQIVVSEISYHPSDPTPTEIALGFDDDNDFEFLELTNVGSGPVDLSPLVLRGGVQFEFSSGSITSLPPGERVLIAHNPDALTARYGDGLPVAGSYQGRLGNAGDRIILEDTEIELVLQDFSYLDLPPWPTAPDGGGFSLVLRNPETSPDHALSTNWRASRFAGGNPGTSDARAPLQGDPLADVDQDGFHQLLEHFLGTSDTVPGDAAGLIAPGISTGPTGSLHPTLQLTFSTGADDLVATAEWSDDLAEWSSQADDLVEAARFPNADGTTTVIWQATRPLNTSRQFFRLKVRQAD